MKHLLMDLYDLATDVLITLYAKADEARDKATHCAMGYSNYWVDGWDLDSDED